MARAVERGARGDAGEVVVEEDAGDELLTGGDVRLLEQLRSTTIATRPAVPPSGSDACRVTQPAPVGTATVLPSSWWPSGARRAYSASASTALGGISVIDGELTLWVGGRVIDAPAGSFVYGPRGIPHTFLVSSETARFLLVTDTGEFSEFVRRLAQPADAVAIPAPATEPPDVAAITRVAAEYGIEILGAPGIPA